jgi:hypothetical protein
LKERGAKIVSRSELVKWEKEIGFSGTDLSEMENKKLHLMKNRLWRRLSSL